MILNILGAKVQVRYVKGLIDEHNSMGRAMFEKNEIHIDASLRGVARKETLIHEVTHWALYRSGLQEGMDRQIEEAICQVISFVVNENRGKI